MLQGSDATFGEAVVWLLACCAAWASARRWIGPWTLAHPRLTIAGAAAAARAIPALVLDRGLFFDIEAHWWVGALTLAGRNVYTSPLARNRYPYPPLHMYVSALMVWLSGHDRSIFLMLDKLIPASCGVALAVTVRAIALRLGMTHERALVIGLLYGLNPLPVMVTSYHGQVEEIPVLLIALAFLLVMGPRASFGGTVCSALLVGLAVGYKTWPLLFLPPLWVAARGPWRRLLYAPLALTPLAAGIGLFGLIWGRAGMHEAASRLLDYKGSNGFCWGYVSALHPCWVHSERLRPNLWVLSLNSKLLVAALAMVCLALLWRRRPLEGMVALPLVFYLFSPGWGPNYSIWVLPFALALSARLAAGYTIFMLPIVSLIYADSLYVAYGRDAFSWGVLKPAEAGLGLAAWIAIAAMVIWLHLRQQPAPAAQAHQGAPMLAEWKADGPRPLRGMAAE